jgi:hypothetical protein
MEQAAFRGRRTWGQLYRGTTTAEPGRKHRWRCRTCTVLSPGDNWNRQPSADDASEVNAAEGPPLRNPSGWKHWRCRAWTALSPGDSWNRWPSDEDRFEALRLRRPTTRHLPKLQTPTYVIDVVGPVTRLSPGDRCDRQHCERPAPRPNREGSECALLTDGLPSHPDAGSSFSPASCSHG